jgi:hypothetical protein
MVSEDSGCASSVHSPVSAASVHGECHPNEIGEPVVSEMPSFRHRPNDVGECQKVSLLRAQEGLRLEEWDDPRQQVFPSTNHEHQCGVATRSMVLLDATTAKPLGDEIQDLTPFGVLTDVKLGHQLPAGFCAFVTTDRYVERTFSIDETREVRIQPFLLIVRTAWIVTAREGTLKNG